MNDQVAGTTGTRCRGAPRAHILNNATRRSGREGARSAPLQIAVLLLALVHAILPRAADAHPADRLKQHLVVELTATQARLTLALGGGILANEIVLAKLDPNGDGAVDDQERARWLAAVVRDLTISLDDRVLALDPATTRATLPPLDDFHLGVAPLVVDLAIPLSDAEAPTEHRLTVRNDYFLDRSDHLYDVVTSPGASVADRSWPGRTIRIAFAVDPALAGADPAIVDRATAWSSGGVVERAKALLERPKTPALILALIAVFVAMGALHALQPGHGKALVAAYLVATGGTPRDALTLAGVVTFTHTISVYLLGLATLAASQFFLPSRVIPVLGIVSGLLVAGMGARMLRTALGRRLDTTLSPSPSPASQERGALPMSATPPPLRSGGGGWGERVVVASHAHAHLSDDDHTRHHLLEALAARDGRRVSFRNLLTLGVSGGLAPCPDALAILLLAVGIGQAGFGLLAIVAFSLGLASVLIAFGLAVALAGPVWVRGRRSAGSGRLGALVGRLVAASPAVSAAVVLLLGLVMIWRAGAGV